jgi:DNA-binding transcriptional regulator YbjK
VLDAALEVLGTGGIHALSHARVDATAGVPAGSTSNHFRTRAALVAGAVRRLRELDDENWRAMSAAPPPADLDALAAAFAAFVDDATGPSRTLTVARYVIYTQGIVEPGLLDALNANRQRIVGWTAGVLGDTGTAADTAADILAIVEGFILHRLSGFSTAPAGPRLTALIRAAAGVRCRE